MRWLPIIQKDCEVGLWVQLSNGWIVGPIIESSHSGIFVKTQGPPFEVEVVNVCSEFLVRDVGTFADLIRRNY